MLLQDVVGYLEEVWATFFLMKLLAQVQSPVSSTVQIGELGFTTADTMKMLVSLAQVLCSCMQAQHVAKINHNNRQDICKSFWQASAHVCMYMWVVASYMYLY